jgi:subtilisin
VVGVAPECQLHMLKVGGFFPVTSAVIAALDWSVANGVKVTNSSFTLSPGPMVQAAYDNSYAAGVVHCAASGNGFPAPIGVPAKYASVIAVGATNKNDSKAPFSQTGPELDVVAPGVDVLSCAVGGGYVLNSGTSMACPHAVGVAALIIGSTGLTDPDDVRQRMIDTAEDLGTPGFDNNFGYGIVDAEAAVGDVAPCAADCNGDGKANILDFLCFQGLVTNGDMGADCTGDGEINVFDWLCFQGLVTKGC